MSFVIPFEYTDAMIYANTHLKGVLGFRGVLDLEFYLLWRSDKMLRKCQDIPSVQCLYKHLQCLHPVMTFWIFVLIYDAIITKIISFVIFTFPSFLPKMNFFTVRWAVMSPRYVHYNLRIQQKLFMKSQLYPKFIDVIIKNN